MPLPRHADRLINVCPLQEEKNYKVLNDLLCSSLLPSLHYESRSMIYVGWRNNTLALI